MRITQEALIRRGSRVVGVGIIHVLTGAPKETKYTVALAEDCLFVKAMRGEEERARSLYFSPAEKRWKYCSQNFL